MGISSTKEPETKRTEEMASDDNDKDLVVPDNRAANRISVGSKDVLSIVVKPSRAVNKESDASLTSKVLRGEIEPEKTVNSNNPGFPSREGIQLENEEEYDSSRDIPYDAYLYEELPRGPQVNMNRRNERIVLTCKICGKQVEATRMSGKEKFVNHAFVHSHHLIYACKVDRCTTRTNTKPQMTTHYKQHHPLVRHKGHGASTIIQKDEAKKALEDAYGAEGDFIHKTSTVKTRTTI